MSSENKLAKSIASGLNRSSNEKVAFFMNDDDSPTNVDTFVSTGSTLLDMLISNREDGGLPARKVVEFHGDPGSGKSLIATHVLANTQNKGGIAVYIDTENAVDPKFIETIGVDTNKNFLYISEHRAGKVFDIIESIIRKVRSKDKDPLITILVDSVAGMTTESEDAADFEKEGYATDKAIVLSKAMRKLTNTLGREKVLLLFTNQVRDNVGCVHPNTTVSYRIGDKTRQGTINSMFKELGTNYKTLDPYDEVDVTEQDVEMKDTQGNWKPLTKLIRKPRSGEVVIYNEDEDVYLSCSKEHRVMIQDTMNDGSIYTGMREVQYLSGSEKIMVTGGEYVPFKVKQTNNTIDIVDVQLGGNHTYESNGIESHNTMYGKSYVVPGGNAIPFHSSVRVYLRSSKKINAKIRGVKEQVGAKIRPRVVKNRLGPPGRTCEFDLFFNNGIDDIGSWWTPLKDYGYISHSSRGWYYVATEIDDEGNIKKYWTGDEESSDDKDDAKKVQESSWKTEMESNPWFYRLMKSHLNEALLVSYDQDWTKNTSSLAYESDGEQTDKQDD